MELSLDSTVLQNLVKTLEDSRTEYTEAASLMREEGDAELAERFDSLAEQRASFVSQLVEFAAARGVEIEVQGSVAGSLHRVWMELKSALSDEDEQAITTALKNAEHHATMEYEDVLDADIDGDLETLLRGQYEAVRDAYQTMDAMSGD